MQIPNTEANGSDKVISLFGRKKEEDSKKNSSDQIDEKFDFAEVVKRNMANKDRLAKERKKANRGVIRSHKLKN